LKEGRGKIVRGFVKRLERKTGEKGGKKSTRVRKKSSFPIMTDARRMEYYSKLIS